MSVVIIRITSTIISSEDSDQPKHPCRLIKLYCPPEDALATKMCHPKTLIRLHGCPGWSEPSMGAHSVLLEMLCPCALSLYLALCQHKIIILNVIYGPAAVKKDIGTYANSEDPDQPAHPRSLVRIFTVRLHNIWTVLRI